MSSPSTAGATVTGDVRLGATAAVGTSADPMKVQVVGSDNVATVSLAGQFVLSGVPSGQIQLHFFGAGADAYVTLSQVASGETVTISVTVVGTSAVIQSESHKGSGDSGEELEGRIESLPPTQPAGTLVVSGRTVTTSATTVIVEGSVTRTFADLAIGQRVHVKGHTDGAVFTASRIEIQNDLTNVPVEVNGTVSGLTGSELSFQFTVNGRLVKGDSNTVFQGANDASESFTDLKNGVRVEVKGQQQDGAVYAVRIHINGSGDNQDTPFDAKGQMSGLTGTCPGLTFTLNGKTITTDASTSFKDSGGCGALANGMTVEVQGVVQTDGSVRATSVDSADGGGPNNDGTDFEGEGPIVGLTGTCPALSFTLKGTPIDTNASTKFDGGSCSSLANGVKADVTGTKQSTGRVLATKVEQ